MRCAALRLDDGAFDREGEAVTEAERSREAAVGLGMNGPLHGLRCHLDWLAPKNQGSPPEIKVGEQALLYWNRREWVLVDVVERHGYRFKVKLSDGRIVTGMRLNMRKVKRPSN